MQDIQDSPQQQACSSTQVLKQPRFCCRCRNHGLRSQFKGHRQQCPYQDCSCDECTLVTERRRIIAKQTALKRRQDVKAMKKAAADIIAGSTDDETGHKKKKKKCSNDLEQMYSSSPEVMSIEPPLVLAGCSSLSSSFSSKASSIPPSPSTAASSPAIEIINSPPDYSTNECSAPDVIKIEQVIFRPIETQEPEAFSPESCTMPMVYAPTSETSCMPLCPNTDKDQVPLVIELPTEHAKYNTHTVLSDSSESYPKNENISLSTSTAPSYSVSPGIISSTRSNLSKMYPYDNSCGIRVSSNIHSSAGYNMMTPPNIKEPSSKMMLLMRVFPETRSHVLQAILDSCHGDPIQCIEIMLNLQDTERNKKPAMMSPSARYDSEKPVMSPAFATPLASPMYIQQPSYQTATTPACSLSFNLQQHPAGVLSASPLSSGGIPSVVPTTYHQSTLEFAPSSTDVMNQPPGGTLAYHRNVRESAYPDPHHASNLCTGHQGAASIQHMQDTAATLPLPTTWASVMSPVTCTAPQFTLHDVPPPPPRSVGSVFCPFQARPPAPPTPLQLPGVAEGAQDPTAFPHLSSPSHLGNTHLTPTHTTTIKYCQTIGTIQPGRCLSYTSTALPSNSGAATSVIVPLMTEPTSSACAGVLRDDHWDNQDVSDAGRSNTYTRWFEPSHPSQTTGASTNLPPSLMRHPIADQELDAVDAVHALVSLRTSPMTKYQMDESHTIKDLLLEEE